MLQQLVDVAAVVPTVVAALPAAEAATTAPSTRMWYHRIVKLRNSYQIAVMQCCAVVWGHMLRICASVALTASLAGGPVLRCHSGSSHSGSRATQPVPGCGDDLLSRCCCGMQYCLRRVFAIHHSRMQSGLLCNGSPVHIPLCWRPA